MGCAQSAPVHESGGDISAALSVNEKDLTGGAVPGLTVSSPRDDASGGWLGGRNPLVTFGDGTAILPMARALPRNRSDMSIRSLGNSTTTTPPPADTPLGDIEQWRSAAGSPTLGVTAHGHMAVFGHSRGSLTPFNQSRCTDGSDSSGPVEHGIPKSEQERLVADFAPWTEGRTLAMNAPVSGFATIGYLDVRRQSFGSYVNSSGEASPLAASPSPGPRRGRADAWGTLDSVALAELEAAEDELRRVELELAAADAELAALNSGEFEFEDEDL